MRNIRKIVSSFLIISLLFVNFSFASTTTTTIDDAKQNLNQNIKSDAVLIMEEETR